MSVSLMHQQDRELIGSTLDGFVTGGDSLGLLWFFMNEDHRPLGYNAAKYGLNYIFLDRGAENLSPRLNNPIKRETSEMVTYAFGFAAGLAANVLSIGLLNACLLGEVYCVDPRAADSSR